MTKKVYLSYNMFYQILDIISNKMRVKLKQMTLYASKLDSQQEWIHMVRFHARWIEGIRN